MKDLETESILNWCRVGGRPERKNGDLGRGLPLPPHIVRVIFSKLPFSNLPFCRLVCKTWNELVLEYASSSEFLPNAFLVSTSDYAPNPTPERFWCNPKMRCIAMDTLTCVASLEFGGDWSNVVIINSCNGLLFISKGASVCDHCCEGILNPMTSEFVGVPLPEIELDMYSHGFGFSPTNKQYKLFRVTPVTHFRTNSPVIMEVFRFGRSRSGSQSQWSHVVDLPFEICDDGAYLNGVIYWIGKEIDKENEFLIYALDVETEKIEQVAKLEVDPHSSPLGSIQAFNDGIYATIITSTPRKIRVWMVLGKDSCIREFVIDDIPNNWVYEFLHLVKVFEDGRILWKIRDDLFCLDNMGRKMKIETFNPNERTVWGFSHIQSLNFGSLPNILAASERVGGSRGIYCFTNVCI